MDNSETLKILCQIESLLIDLKNLEEVSISVNKKLNTEYKIINYNIIIFKEENQNAR